MTTQNYIETLRRDAERWPHRLDYRHGLRQAKNLGGVK